jgi:hypothetical protein
MSIIGGSQLGFRWRWPGGEPGLPDYPNSGFEDNLTGWTLVNNRFHFNSSGRSPTVINGVPAPPNPNPNPYGSPGDVHGMNFQSWTGSIVNHNSGGGVGVGPPDGGLKCVNLVSFGQITGGGGSIYGPYFYSNNAVFAGVGDKIEFYWRCYVNPDPSKNDAFAARAYAFNKLGNYIILLNESASGFSSTSWALKQHTILPGQEGSYYFVFVCGSWDATYGRIVGSSLLVDNVKLRKSLFTGE